MSFPLEDWQTYASSGPAPELLAVPLQPTVADLAALRKTWPQGVVAVAVENARARNRAASKFDATFARRLFADEQGVMVASSLLAAKHKAARFAQTNAPAFDLCCGIGADACEFVRSGVDTLAVDRDPVRAWMAEANAGCPSEVGDVGSAAWLDRIADGLVHLDPSRRDSSKRRHDYEAYRPGPAIIEAIIGAAAGTCVKLGPGVDLSLLPEPEGSHLEFVSEHGRLTQALLWTGVLAATAALPEGHRRATLLPSGESFSAQPGPLIDADEWYDSNGPATPVLDYLYEADPTLERPGLLGPFAGTLGVRPIHPAVGLLTSENKIESSWLTTFEVLDTMPWRTKAVRSRLHELGAGVVAVKTRAKLVDPDALQKTLRGKGDEPLVVFILKLGQKATTIIARRLG
ncbi:MAG: hypothetical protein NCW75_06105 [Phycisphaera sp.]|nr:MAG: hypothetical protein NCW75_06105 [Phycisphaera sp.]